MHDVDLNMRARRAETFEDKADEFVRATIATDIRFARAAYSAGVDQGAGKTGVGQERPGES